MMQLDTDSLADMKLVLEWQDSAGKHSEVYDACGVNLWRDILPRDLYHELMGKRSGESVRQVFEAGAPLVGYHPRSLFTINRSQFGLPAEKGLDVSARIGRFYPKGILRNVSGVFPQNKEPFRCVKIKNGHLVVDFNHPLVDQSLSVEANIKKVIPKLHERGGSSIDWIEVLTNGPGMQCRWRDQPTDFFQPDAFSRADMTSDDRFYSTPRLVHHIDITGRGTITDLYGRLLSRSKRVLDLMSSWVSHLPDHPAFDKVVGLGMNPQELSKNPRLDDFVVHDLNADPHLPFTKDSFDAAICTASIEYLTDPMVVFKEMARVLESGSPFIITFSNRWFAPKAVNIWSQLHEFERMGLVTEYFLRSEKFGDLHTFSRRGLPRDREDKYFGQLPYADPIYAVWGYKL